MSAVEHAVVIGVPVEQVYAAILQVEEAPHWMVGLQEVHRVSGRAVGDGFDWVFKMAGSLTFKGHTTFGALEPDRYVREDGSGDLTNTWHWRLAPELSGTRVHVVVEYTVPGGNLLGGVLDKLFVERQNQKDLEQSLNNLRRRLEG